MAYTQYKPLKNLRDAQFSRIKTLPHYQKQNSLNYFESNDTYWFSAKLILRFYKRYDQ